MESWYGRPWNWRYKNPVHEPSFFDWATCVFAGVSGADRRSSSKSGWNTAADTMWVRICSSSRKWQIDSGDDGTLSTPSQFVVCFEAFILMELRENQWIFTRSQTFLLTFDLFYNILNLRAISSNVGCKVEIQFIFHYCKSHNFILVF